MADEEHAYEIREGVRFVSRHSRGETVFDSVGWLARAVQYGDWENTLEIDLLSPLVLFDDDGSGVPTEIRVQPGTDPRVCRALAALFEVDVLVSNE